MKKKPAGRVLLSIDWDFFFPIPEYDPHMLYDWAHREDKEMFYGIVWLIRAAGFFSQGYELPVTSGEEKDFWSRFKLRHNAALYYAESHSLILHQLVSAGVTRVLSFDAHHDAGYSGQFKETDQVGCYNWAAHLASRGVEVKVIHPAWKYYAFDCEETSQVEVERMIDNGSPITEEIDAVFVCRSGAWTPGWLDDDFDGFLKNCPLSRQIQVGELIEREWESDTAREMASKEKQLIETSLERKPNDEIT